MNLYQGLKKRACQRRSEIKRKQAKTKSLTSSEETIGTWASRETSASLVFFARFWFRAFVWEIFFTEALVILGATSSSAGSSVATGEATEACAGGSSSSLHDNSKL
jgi:hypothetical protein